MKEVDGTKERIIRVASQLFLTKGYDATRLSDILNGLNGLTKGAIYHHFESKEAIFNAVVEKFGAQNAQLFDTIKNDSTLTAIEKLQQIVRSSITNGNMSQIIERSPSLLDNPKLLSTMMKEIEEVTIPFYLIPILEEGQLDGSIPFVDTGELAEFLAISFNIWLNPLLFQTKNTSLVKKIELLNQLLYPIIPNLFEASLIEQLKQDEQKH